MVSAEKVIVSATSSAVPVTEPPEQPYVLPANVALPLLKTPVIEVVVALAVPERASRPAAATAAMATSDLRRCMGLLPWVPDVGAGLAPVRIMWGGTPGGAREFGVSD